MKHQRHSACMDIIQSFGSNANCCACSGHKCRGVNDIQIERFKQYKENFAEECAVERIQKQGGIPMVVCNCPKCNIVSF